KKGNPESKASELRKPMGKFTELKHMAMFGRPLRFAYDDKDMDSLARLKLVGGNPKKVYNANHHIFPALSFRLSSDVCLQNPRTLPFTKTAFNPFIRVIISMDHDAQFLHTLPPSEP